MSAFNVQLRSAARLMGALAALAFSASAAGAQTARTSLREAELRRSTAANLYEAIAELRPDWLLGSVGVATASSADNVQVFLDGRHVGNLYALRSIHTEQVLAVRLRSPEYVRRTMLRFPRQQYTVALFVATRTASSQRQQGRVTLSLDAGYNVRSLPQVARAALHDRGYTRDFATADSGIVQFANEGTENPITLGGTLYYRVRGGWGAALAVRHTLNGRAGGLNPRRAHAVSTTITSTEAALLLTREAPGIRVGVGPSVRRVEWAWADGFCRCDTKERSSGSAAGIAAELLVPLPLRSAPVYPQLGILARYYPSDRTEYSGLEDGLDVHGLVVTIGVGVATRF